jgi:hypothetical protein
MELFIVNPSWICSLIVLHTAGVVKSTFEFAWILIFIGCCFFLCNKKTEIMIVIVYIIIIIIIRNNNKNKN